MIKGMRIGEDAYEMELGPVAFTAIAERNNHGRPSLSLHWVRETQYRNIIWHRILGFHWRSPWVKMVASFVKDD